MQTEAELRVEKDGIGRINAIVILKEARFKQHGLSESIQEARLCIDICFVAYYYDY
jgi:hypothetical protein